MISFCSLVKFYSSVIFFLDILIFLVVPSDNLGHADRHPMW